MNINLKMNKYATKAEIRQLLDECIETLRKNKVSVTENRVINFGNTVYPKFGWCVILGGGGGSGKGWVVNHQLPIDGRIVNVDDWKKYYARMNGIEYNPRDPRQVSDIHHAISNKRWKQKTIDNIMNPQIHDKRKLPNIIFDMTAKNPYHDVIGLAEDMQDYGYKTMLVWVVATRHEAIIRNLQRSRRIPDEILHHTYNELMDNMPKFLQGSYATECLDDAWIIFSSAPNIDRSDLKGDETKTAAVQLKRGQKGFVIDKDTMERLISYLGEKETNVENPKTFLSSDEVADRYGIPKNDGSFNIDRSRLDLDKKLYR